MSNLPGLAVRAQSARWWLLVLVPQKKKSLRPPLTLVPNVVVILQPPPLQCCGTQGSACAGVFRENLSSTFPVQELLSNL